MVAGPVIMSLPCFHPGDDVVERSRILLAAYSDFVEIPAPPMHMPMEQIVDVVEGEHRGPLVLTIRAGSSSLPAWPAVRA